ncbi:MAG TPA: hypothetical protein VFH31_17770, partial [Pyrinomonadaceae bacterium]|nr:hypothetical protein [Pyrinomonadaceae bacterium]
IHAGDYERGLTYAKRAAHEAERVFAFDEAIAAYNRAFECAEALGHIDEQVAQQEAIGKVYMLHGETIGAGEHFENALALPSDPTVRVRLQLEAASSLVAIGDQRAVEYVRSALGVLDPSANPLETARALSLEARFHHLAGTHLKAIELLEQAADLVAPAAAADSITSFAAPMITQIYAYLAGANQHYGRYVEADHWARRAIDFGAAHNVLYAQALGFEYLGENSIHKGDFQAGLKYADTEFEIIEKLRSRERRVWTHFVAAMCSSFMGDSERAEREFTEGIELADAIGELRGASLLKGNFAILQAEQANKKAAESASDKVERQRLLDEALQLALENFKAGNSLGLLYSSFEAHRNLAEVRFRRGELDEAERLCVATSELISGTESRVSQLWLGPLYMDVLLAAGKRSVEEGKLNDAAAKFDLAAEHLARYQSLVAECQSPRFTREAERLAKAIAVRNS